MPGLVACLPRKTGLAARMKIHFTCQWKGGAYVSAGGAAVYIVIVGAGESVRTSLKASRKATNRRRRY